jgi:hypothetical protein
MNIICIYAIALVDHLWKPFILFSNISGTSGTEIKIKNTRDNEHHLHKNKSY